MHPLSLFPHLFDYPLLAYFILRLVVAWAIFRVGQARRKKSYKFLAILDFLAGVLVLIGLYTQGALILVMILLIKECYLNKRAGIIDKKEDLILSIIFVIALALMFLGPGMLALDLPL